MSALDNIKSLLRNQGHMEAQTKETLVKCFEQLLAGQGEITSPQGTINVTPGNPTTVEVTGLPPYDVTDDLGGASRRWVNVVLDQGGAIAFDDGHSSRNQIAYIDGLGPAFSNRQTDKNLIFDESGFTGHRTATWQNSSGTVAWDEDFRPLIPTNPKFQTVVSTDSLILVPVGVVTAIVIKEAGTIAALTINFQDGDFAGQIIFVSSDHIVTALTVGDINTTNEGLALPTTWAANQTFGFCWDDGTLGGTVGWMRFQ